VLWYEACFLPATPPGSATIQRNETGAASE